MPLPGKPQTDLPTVISKGWLLSGGSLKKSAIVDDVLELSHDQLFVRVRKESKWVSEFVTGEAWGNHPLKGTKVFELILQKLQKALLQQEMVKVKASESNNAVIGLGLDDEADEAQHSLAKRRKTAAKHTGKDKFVEIQMPVEPDSTEMVAVKVLSKLLKDAIWLELKDDTLSWLRRYMRAELASMVQEKTEKKEQGNKKKAAKDEAQAVKDQSMEVEPYWCSAASSWRVKTLPGNSPKTYYVARRPEETFLERCQAMKQLAKDRALEEMQRSS